MITLEQIQVLDKKIKDAIDLINRLREEKKTLNKKIVDQDETIVLLEQELSSCQNDSDQIEEGFKEVLSQLDLVEDSDVTPGQQETSEIQPQTDNEDDAIEEDKSEANFTSGDNADEESLDTEEDENPEITEEPIQETMQFEALAEESVEDPASEKPDIDEGIPLTPDDTIIEEESQVNHLEQQENEDSRSPQDLDIF